ncbi:MAG: hypothetical protein RJA55_2994 [Acidobacteriota bacterium]|jgi:hypothetical protein
MVRGADADVVRIRTVTVITGVRSVGSRSCQSRDNSRVPQSVAISGYAAVAKSRLRMVMATLDLR